MKLGRAYKLAAVAAAHKARAIACLESHDHEGARRAELGYLDQVEEIPSHFRRHVSPFLDEAIELKVKKTRRVRLDS